MIVDRNEMAVLVTACLDIVLSPLESFWEIISLSEDRIIANANEAQATIGKIIERLEYKVDGIGS